MHALVLRRKTAVVPVIRTRTRTYFPLPWMAAATGWRSSYTMSLASGGRIASICQESGGSRSPICLNSLAPSKSALDCSDPKPVLRLSTAIAVWRIAMVQTQVRAHGFQSYRKSAAGSETIILSCRFDHLLAHFCSGSTPHFRRLRRT